MVDRKDKGEGIREEFIAEAQELIEGLSRDLLVLDHAQQQNAVDPETVNNLFRGVHTLKGLAGMFGFSKLGQLAHRIEDLLEDLRLGRVVLNQSVLDILFEGVDTFQRLLAEAKNPEEIAEVDIEHFERSIKALAVNQKSSSDIIAEYEIDPGVIAVLTEYETHRLRTNLSQGITVYRLHLRLSLDVIDTVLKQLKERGRKVAEIITYLPSMSVGPDEMIDIDVLLASNSPESELIKVLDQSESVLSVIQRRTPHVPPPAPTVTIPEKRDAQPVGAAIEKSDEPSGDGFAIADRAGDPLSLRSVMNTVRVDIRKLDHLMNAVGELGIVRGALGRALEKMRDVPGLNTLTGELRRIHRSFERCLIDVQDDVFDVRMVPLGHFFNKLGRIVRQVARENVKEVRMVVSGSETEVDKLIAEELADPLMHIVRNAIDHGIESPSERESRGKPIAGTLAINAYQKGNHVVVEVQDDGRGIDPKRIKQAAIDKEILSKEQLDEMSTSELLDVIFLPGLSTAESVSDISGRGIGMDVVKTNLARLGGMIELHSEVGVGTKFTITLPITLAIISALVVEVAGRTFAIPLSTIQEAIKLDPRAIRTMEGREILTLRGTTLPICRLADRFGFSRETKRSRQFVVVVVHGARRLGFVVDKLRGQQDIVIKSLAPSLQGTRGIAGATDLGDQRLVLVLDAPTLLDEFAATSRTNLLQESLS
ncbi:MAG: chemotaxis protein CheA [Deltaproteobacteria bacterium]|nr:chemotaxis protein CheA [Deltaproteobacteria bacterium]